MILLSRSWCHTVLYKDISECGFPNSLVCTSETRTIHAVADANANDIQSRQMQLRRANSTSGRSILQDRGTRCSGNNQASVHLLLTNCVCTLAVAAVSYCSKWLTCSLKLGQAVGRHCLRKVCIREKVVLICRFRAAQYREHCRTGKSNSLSERMSKSLHQQSPPNAPPWAYKVVE